MNFVLDSHKNLPTWTSSPGSQEGEEKTTIFTLQENSYAKNTTLCRLSH